MNLLRGLAGEIRKMFAANLGLSLGVLALLAIAAGLGRWAGRADIAAVLLLGGSPVVLAVSAARASRRLRSGRGR